ncbi:class I SAM-dependent methyltransferase [Dyadobacter sp. CY261]|uniref:class I SAM-dependent methyltransferase n=1 Tax=Dyadobacter sp. CY261 TaxID=2907203 RepID=UPI001F195408|nr:class I SAM-dependent methyltransferase [Dyadobacter sp. CY261]MCF0071488.1 class I SAM-dependent methyltransferase [Dyadobacter sp. CY261]
MSSKDRTASDNSMKDLFYSHSGNLIHKWDHYLDIYPTYLSQYRGRRPTILEIGVSHGGSIQLWKQFFGNDCQIFAIDINPECSRLEEEGVKIFIGSQADANFLNEVAHQIPDLDFVLDDGGHFMDQQSLSFEILFPKVKQGGQYIVEDTHTSYWPEFGGGLRKDGTFIEKSKALIDSLYNYHLFEGDNVRTDNITQNIESISFFDSMVIFQKRLRAQPFHKQIGKKTINPYVVPEIKKPKSLSERILAMFSKKQAEEIHPFVRNDGGIDEIK